MFGALGMPEIIIVAVIAILIFGPSRLPKLGKSMGETIREFRNLKSAIKEGTEEVKGTAHEIEREIRR